jgi:hypothetical protein
LQAWEISVLTISARLQFDLPTPYGKMIGSLRAISSASASSQAPPQLRHVASSSDDNQVSGHGKTVQIVELAKAGLSEPLIGIKSDQQEHVGEILKEPRAQNRLAKADLFRKLLCILSDSR